MRPIIVLDLKTLPIHDSWRFEDWLKLYEERGIAIWDSEKDGNEPRVYYLDDNTEIEIIDINQLEFDFTYDN